jgi:transcriptional regulator with XRE-family HTH domain
MFITNYLLNIVFQKSGCKTKYRFAKELGEPKMTIGNYLNGKNELKLSKLQEFADKFNIQINISWKSK